MCGLSLEQNRMNMIRLHIQCNPGWQSGNPLISSSLRIFPNYAVTFFLGKNGCSRSPLINTGDVSRDVTFFLRSVHGETPTTEKPAASIKISPSLMLRLSFCDSNPWGFGETLSSPPRSFSRASKCRKQKKKKWKKKRMEKENREKRINGEMSIYRGCARYGCTLITRRGPNDRKDRGIRRIGDSGYLIRAQSVSRTMFPAVGVISIT